MIKYEIKRLTFDKPLRCPQGKNYGIPTTNGYINECPPYLEDLVMYDYFKQSEQYEKLCKPTIA